MQFNKIIIAMGAAAAMFMGAAAHADSSSAASTITVNGGTIHFKGDLVDAPCAISTDSQDQIVKLGEYTLNTIKKEGHGSKVPFTIKLEDCDTTTYKTAAVAFQGAVDAGDATLLAIDSGTTDSNAPTAAGVGIQITDNASKVIKPDGSEFSTKQALIDNVENVMHFNAQYIADKAELAAGQANADATFIMQYN